MIKFRGHWEKYQNRQTLPGLSDFGKSVNVKNS